MLLLCCRFEAHLLNANMERNHEMSGGPGRVHGGEVVPLNRGLVPPSAPSTCTIDGSSGGHKISGKCSVGA